MTSTFINLPPPPSDPVTPSEIPGTPNSGTTSLSALSTVAIKDGHQGHLQQSHHHRGDPLYPAATSSNTSTTTLDAERADRISRLAGLERVSTVRQPSSSNATGQPSTSQAAAAAAGGGAGPQTPVGYFDATGNPVLLKGRSTVGSASATGSMGGRTTWASGSQDGDKMSEGEDTTNDGGEDTLSQGGLSDDANASLVGFGEGANSVVEGPASTISTTSGPTKTLVEQLRARGAGLDRDGPHTPGSVQGTPAPRHAGLSGKETTERIVQERIARGDGDVRMSGSD